ncbi:hypothetical protein ABZT47_14930 [Sphaerisporangium sp. NPDC005289]|uniref:hypothetical protein n=1 Tax=Sphaerisporangium sp. NPDC005289 TaxID=3155247 RepID=UPI00339E7C96
MARTELYAGKAKAVAAAQQAGLIDDTIDPAYLIFLVIAVELLVRSTADRPDAVRRRRAGQRRSRPVSPSSIPA